MASITVAVLTGEHPFGARIGGVTHEALRDEAIRQQIRDVFEDRGMILFEGIEPSDEMQAKLSNVFGPPRAYAIKDAPIQKAGMPGVVDLGAEAEKSTVFEIDGKLLANWVNWHFDACYTNELNRAGLLRLTVITPELGLTGFADGVQIHDALSPEWREIAEGLEIVYQESLMLHRQRYGMPPGAKLISLQAEAEVMIRQAEHRPRAIHPAVWQRKSGEKVLHICPWQAVGIAGREDAEGDALFAALWDEVRAKMNPYWHKWRPDQMVIWDNWRFVHAVSGHDPKYPRNARRTTIAGDYGLGRFAEEPA